MIPDYGATADDTEAWLDPDDGIRPGTAQGPATNHGLLADVRSGSWLDEQDFPPLRYTVPGIVPEGTTVLAGAPKIGKSWLALHLALAVSSGSDVLGCLPIGPPRPALYLALEDGHRRLQSRARSLLAGQPIPTRLDVLIKVGQGQAPATVGAWLDQHGDHAPLVIVDTLGRVMPPSRGGDSAYAADYRAVGSYKQLADAHPGTSIVIVHHTRKLQAGDFVDSVSGTLGITGAADSAVVLTRARADDGGRLRVTGRDVDEAEYSVTKDASGLWTLTGDSFDAAQRAATTERVAAGVGSRAEDIIRVVVDSAEPIGPGDIADKLGLPVKVLGTYLTRLIKAGRLRRVGRGQYTAAT
jgi:hypothetical protein